MASISRRPTGTVTAAITALHLKAEDVDTIDEATDANITYYMTMECTGQDTARSPIFTGPGDFEWEGWVPPAAGSWTAHIRKTSDDSSVANLAITVS